MDKETQRKIRNGRRHIFFNFLMAVFYLGGVAWGLVEFLIYLVYGTGPSFGWLWPLATGIVGFLVNVWIFLKRWNP